jgi:hypothetical protein
MNNSRVVALSERHGMLGLVRGAQGNDLQAQAHSVRRVHGHPRDVAHLLDDHEECKQPDADDSIGHHSALVDVLEKRALRLLQAKGLAESGVSEDRPRLALEEGLGRVRLPIRKEVGDRQVRALARPDRAGRAAFPGPEKLSGPTKAKVPFDTWFVLPMIEEPAAL